MFNIQFEHLLFLSGLLLFVAVLITSHIAHIRKLGYDTYFAREYSAMHPDHSRDDFTLYIYSSFCLAAMLYMGSLASAVGAFKILLTIQS